MSATPQRIAILGATSAIAEASARIWASKGAQLALVARDETRLRAIGDDLKARGATEVVTFTLDCAKADARAEIDRMASAFGGLDIVLLAYGVLGDQAALLKDPAGVEALMQVNFNSAAAWSLATRAILARQRSGVLVVIGSVAGDRGRQSNYLYGASKSGLGAVVQGIAHELAPTGARAVLVKPGFVDTPMTAAFAKKGPLWTKPETVATIIARAAEKGGPIVYAPRFWRLIMLVIRCVPAFVFHKTKL